MWHSTFNDMLPVSLPPVGPDLHPIRDTVHPAPVQGLHKIRTAVAGETRRDHHLRHHLLPLRAGLASDQHRVHSPGGGVRLSLRRVTWTVAGGGGRQLRLAGGPQHTQAGGAPPQRLQVHPERYGAGHHEGHIGAALLQDRLLFETDAHPVRAAKHDIRGE